MIWAISDNSRYGATALGFGPNPRFARTSYIREILDEMQTV